MRGSEAEGGDGRVERDQAAVSYGEFKRARERFFELLRVDSEKRRLERAWAMPTREPWHEHRAS